jgi:hypothetical protein
MKTRPQCYFTARRRECSAGILPAVPKASGPRFEEKNSAKAAGRDVWRLDGFSGCRR